jgi:hypothetical protein
MRSSIWFVHRGVEYTVVLSEKPDRWAWRFSIDSDVKTGKVTAKLDLYAWRLVQKQIERELRRLSRSKATAE